MPFRSAHITFSFAALALAAGLSACSATSTASCSEFREEFEQFEQFDNPKVVEIVRDAYFDKHPERDSVSGIEISRQIVKVSSECNANPDADVDDFIE